MKKVFLITLWILIAAAAIFLMRQGYFKPDIKDTSLDKPPTSSEQNPVNTIDLSEGNKNYQEYIALGNASLKSQKFAEAAEYFLNAVKQDPKSEAFFGLGQSYLGDKNPKAALESFQSAAEINPDEIDIQLGITQALLDTREIEKAKAVVWELSDSDPRVQYYKAMLLILFREYEQAQKIFATLAEQNSTASADIKQKSAIFLGKFNTFSYYPNGETIFLETMLAKAMTENGQYQAAIPILFDIINTQSNYRDAWIILGYAYLNSNQIQDAIDALTKAKDLDDEKPETLFFLGIAYSLNDDIGTAIQFLEKADKLGYKPQDQIQAKLGDLYLLQEEYEKSSDSYEEALRLNTSDIGIFVRAVWINIDKINRPEKALEIAQNAMASHPSKAMSFNLMGWAYSANNDFEKAEEYLNQAISLYPEFDAAHLNMGLMYEKQDQLKLAQDYYAKAAKLGNGNSITTLANKRIETINNSLKISP